VSAETGPGDTMALAPWQISPRDRGIEVRHHGKILWEHGQTQVELADGTLLSPTRATLDGTVLTMHFADELVLRHEFSADQGWLRITTTLHHGGSRPLPLRQVRVLEGRPADGPWERVFAQSNTMTGQTGVFVSAGHFDSDACFGLTDAAGTTAMAAGFEKLDDAFYQFGVDVSAGEFRITPVCLREDIPLAPGATLKISPLLIGGGESLGTLLDEYAHFVASALGARRSGETMTGWCSWYHYYGQETSGDILANARSLAASPLGRNLKVIQIDDGWNRPSNDQPRVWGDWFAGGKFPQGMRAVADELHDLGFQAGLWLAPFSVDKASRLAAEHPDWLLRVKNPETGLLDPAGPGHVFGLDLTHPAVLSWLETTFERVFREWDFDYVKIDFLMHGVLPGERHDPRQTSAQAFRQAMQVIRRCAGANKFILACGSPLGPAIGLCDAMRIGPDVGGRWFTPVNLAQWPHGNCSIRAAAYPTLFRQWMHRIWWQNDPDCLLVRDRAVPFEIEAMTAIKARLTASDLGVAPSDFGLSREEAAFWVRAVWFTGGMNLLSEVWDELPPDRQQLLARAFPPHTREVRWLDYYEHPDVCVLHTVEGPPMVGIFNLSEEPRSITFPRSRLAGAATWTEWLSGETIRLEPDLACFPVLEPRSARIWMATP